MKTARFRGESLVDWRVRLQRQQEFWGEEAAYFERLAAKLVRRARITNIIFVVCLLGSLICLVVAAVFS